MALRDKMRRWVQPHLEPGEQADVVVIVQDRFRTMTGRAIALGLGVFVVVLGTIAALVVLLGLPGLVLSGSGGVVSALVLAVFGPEKRYLARTDRSLCVLGSNPLTGRPTSRLERLPRDVVPELTTHRMIDHVTLGPYDLRTGRRFREDLRRLARDARE